jgi:hypothetical protein
VHFSIESITIYDFTGSSVLRIDSPEEILDISPLKKGIYTIQFRTLSGAINKKLVVSG